MSLTLAPPTRLAALVGVLVLTGLGAVMLFVGRGVVGGGATSSSAPPVPLVKPATPVTPAPRTHAPKPVRVPSGFPARVDHALRYGRVVVVSVSVPGSAVDRIVKREAALGAKSAHVPFVAYSAANERAMNALLAKTGVLPSPAILVVKRPGVVTSTFSAADAATISQAATQARR
jgi:hypothetical protein